MSKNCQQFQEVLMDIYYGETTWDDDLKDHLRDCQECSQHWQQLEEMKAVLMEPIEAPIEYTKIRGVMEVAEGIQEKRRNLKSLALFLLVASALLGSMASLAVGGYGKTVLYLQIILHAALPISLPFIIKKRMAKEGYND